MKMEIFGPLILSVIAGLSTLIGGLLIYIDIKRKNEFIVFSLSFSIVIMILISLIELLPQSISFLIIYYNKFIGILVSLLIFFLGYLTIYFITNKIQKNSSLYKIGIMSSIALMIHNFPEGIAVFMSGYINIKIGFKLFIATLLHNIPEGITIAIPLYYSKQSRGYSLKYTLISGIAEPIGALISFLFLKNFINNLIISFILIYVSGLMISLSINEIYKEIKTYNLQIYKFIGYVSGIILFIILTLIL